MDRLQVATTTISDVYAGANREVARRALLAGVWIWPMFTLLDAYMCFVAYPGAPFQLFLIYRVVVEVIFVAEYRLSYSEKVDPDRLFLLLRLTFFLTALTIALMAVHLGGTRSPYMHGISIVALVWAALVPTHWRRALPTFVGIGIAFPVVMGIGAAVDPAARAEWLSTEALVVFGGNYVFVLASSTLSVILCHLVWSAQQKARRLGSYELEETLGKGGMGEVWRAKHHFLARRAAIKLIRPEALGRDDASRQTVLARFEREAQATASLRSPHTIQVYDFGVSETGVFYYVMELLEGFDAAALLDRFGPLPPERAVKILLQICDSLGEAHAVGLIHRDIKPSNIFVCRYGRTADFVKVLDFGLVKPTDRTKPQLTGEQGATGTPAYMSPEQALGSGTLDARADLYSVGCVAYFLLTGRNVFEGQNIIQIMMQHLDGTPAPLSQHVGQSIPSALESVVMACLEKEPANRPQSADALADELRRCLDRISWTQQHALEWWDLNWP